MTGDVLLDRVVRSERQGFEHNNVSESDISRIKRVGGDKERRRNALRSLKWLAKRTVAFVLINCSAIAWAMAVPSVGDVLPSQAQCQRQAGPSNMVME